MTTLYTGKTHTVGGREGMSRSSDGRLDIKLSTPGGTSTGTNPEQLFAAGWSACFTGALQRVARNKRIALPGDLAVDAEIDLCQKDDAFFLQTRLDVVVPGMDFSVAQELVEAAHQTCPYSKATRGNIDVKINVVCATA